VIADRWEVGWGYLEVVRSASTGEIYGLHWLPAECASVYVYNDRGDYLIRVTSLDGGGDRYFPLFGDSENVPAEYRMDPSQMGTISEVIEFKVNNNRSRFYGFAQWLAAMPPMDIVKATMQFCYDFFLNRGVPEFMLFVKGQKLEEADWKVIEDALQENTGLGNSHKSFALNLPYPDLEVQVEKLALDSKAGKDEMDKKESCTMDIVSAHQTPPLLAGILIPGKLGATNELPNALAAYQLLVIGPAQKNIQRILTATLGSEGAGLGLNFQDFQFKTITDELDLQAMDTSSRMRETEVGSDRDLSEGLRD
jgi:capsid portal protein